MANLCAQYVIHMLIAFSQASTQHTTHYTHHSEARQQSWNRRELLSVRLL